ncbi:MAG: tRNA (N6-isopentenyl adenosine(37)-C2)-methylthiotransferase MiaB [Bacteroidetes bacterium HGW-Bacteroidetes-17]|nr:MAG: tRNA (N6-isopentenyl adenosine(37)-C2)-methylthiotransferase MiaB [Bacteroidetes bacterium HGW-Bacteroidetes-17]
MKYHLITLGCQMNLSDSGRLSTVLNDAGFVYTDHEEEANVLGILACSVRQNAINKVYSRISKWNKRKGKENLITFISGCILDADKEKFLKLFDFVFQMSEVAKLPEMINQYGVTSQASVRNSSIYTDINQFWNIKPQYDSAFEAFVPIQNGCDKFCTFCAVPYTRGREVSRSSDEIIQEVKSLLEKGYKSITLLGQNVNSYGLDKNGDEISFAELLRRIGELGKISNHKFWLYFTSPHPRDMNDEVIDVIAEYPCLAKQIHLPLQSGDDKVLIRMNRKHNLSKYRSIVEKIRITIPEATLFTDIIVGFTGETDEQFENTMKAFDEFKFNMAYIAKYSPRPGAASSRWVDDIPNDLKKERLALLTDKLQSHVSEYNQNLIGKTLTVLVLDQDRKDEFLTGLTEGKINIRFKSDDASLIGKFCDIKVISNAAFSLEGELINANSEVLA